MIRRLLGALLGVAVGAALLAVGSAVVPLSTVVKAEAGAHRAVESGTGDHAGAGPEAGWTGAPYPVAAALVGATAREAALVSPPAATLTPVTSAPGNGLWTASECNWVIDTLYADRELDHSTSIAKLEGLSVGGFLYYDNASADWGVALTDAEMECSSSVVNGGSFIMRDIQNFQWAGSTHAPLVTQNGPSDTWDLSWEDAYAELIDLFTILDPTHQGCPQCLG